MSAPPLHYFRKYTVTINIRLRRLMTGAGTLLHRIENNIMIVKLHWAYVKVHYNGDAGHRTCSTISVQSSPERFRISRALLKIAFGRKSTRIVH